MKPGTRHIKHLLKCARVRVFLRAVCAASHTIVVFFTCASKHCEALEPPLSPLVSQVTVGRIPNLSRSSSLSVK